MGLFFDKTSVENIMKNIKKNMLFVGLLVMPLVHAQQSEDTWWT